jgi:hypothetical protein
MVSNYYAEFDYGSPRKFNGWYFTTSGLDYIVDPFHMTLEGSIDNSTWTLIGTSRWEHSELGELILRNETFHLPATRKQDINFDMRAPWTWLLANVVAPLLTFVGLSAAAAAGLARRARGCATALCACLATVGCVYLVAAVGRASADRREALLYLAGALWSGLLPLGMALSPGRHTSLLTVFGTLRIGASLVRTLHLRSASMSSLLFSDLLYPGCALILVAAAIEGHNRCAIVRGPRRGVGG